MTRSKGYVAFLLIFAVCAICAVGCQKTSPVSFVENKAEFLKQERLELNDGQTFPEKYYRLSEVWTNICWGTPDHPSLPVLEEDDDPVNQLFDLELLKKSAGAVASDREGESVGLYREHCAHCHGITGDGAGPTAGLLNPYPRDFRLGKFKFKSTPLRIPPTDEDLRETIRGGIPGTGMPGFQTLSDDEVNALIEYVKYLSVRGQHERMLIAQLAVMEPDVIESLNTPQAIAAGERHTLSHLAEFNDQVELFVTENLIDNGFIESWLSAEDNATVVPTAPPEYNRSHTAHSQFISEGRSLFSGKANCIQCHGKTGVGDGQTNNFDDWTKDWLSSPGVDPTIPQSLQPFLAAGKLKPRSIRPRNLRLPVFRGGAEGTTLFRVIRNGIEGTPMPSSTVLSDREIWALVAYVKQLPFEKESTNEND